MIRIEECILYRDFAEGEVLRDMTILVETYKKLVNAQISLKDRRFRENMSAYEPQFYEALNRLVEMANRYGFSGNLWHDYLTYLLVNKENAFSTSCEIVGKVEGSINQMAKHDFVRFKELFDFDICVFDEFSNPAMLPSSAITRTPTARTSCSTKKSATASANWPSVLQKQNLSTNLWMI